MTIHQINWTDLPHQDKFDRLYEQLRAHDRLLVAYSGGVDSTLLMKAGVLALGKDCIGVTVHFASLPEQEYNAALAVAYQHNFHVRTIYFDEFEVEPFVANSSDRCYYCKRELFERIRRLGQALNIRTVCDGSSAEDVDDWRPGLKAIAELQILSPLREAGLTKREIRELARALGLPNWNRPANPCLASRIPYGERIDREKLQQVGQGEQFLHELGFQHVRVRHHGQVARIEVEPDKIPDLTAPSIRRRVADHLRHLGFRHVAVDLLGYRSGSLNPHNARAARKSHGSTPDPDS